MIWKPIKGFKSYQISNTGLIKRANKILSPFNNQGYLRILLHEGDKHQKKLVHRLVAEAFIPNPDNKPQINHIDLDKKNNHVDNLEWVTNKENVAHAIKHIPERRKQLKQDMSKIGKKHGRQNGINSSKPINQYDLEGKLINTFESARDAHRQLGYSYKVISKCCNGNSKTYKGFIWKFANE